MRLAILILAALPAWAGYAFHNSVKIKASQVPSTQSNFPMLVSGTYPFLATVPNGGAVHNTTALNGVTVPADVIFTSDAGCTTLLNWEVVSYTATSGVNFEAWVQIPSITNGTVFYICYGNAAITTYQGNSTSVWDANYKGVWHLWQDPGGTAPQFTDSTSNGYNLTVATDAGTPAQVSGEINGAVNFPTASEYHGTHATRSANVGVGATNIYSVSCWVKMNSFLTQDFGYNLLCGSGGSSPFIFEAVIVTSAGGLGCTIENTNTYGSVNTATSAMSLGTWYYATCTNDGSTLKFYLNGSVVSSVSSGGDAISDNPFLMNIHPAGLYHNDAQFDETHISNSTRSADWITAEYNNQSSPAAFYAVGAAVGTASSTAGMIIQ